MTQPLSWEAPFLLGETVSTSKSPPLGSNEDKYTLNKDMIQSERLKLVNM